MASPSLLAAVSLVLYLSWLILAFRTTKALPVVTLYYLVHQSPPHSINMLAIFISKHRWPQFSSPPQLSKSWEGNGWLGFGYLLKEQLFQFQMIAELGGEAVPGWGGRGLLGCVVLFLLLCLEVMSLWFLQLVRPRMFTLEGSWAPGGSSGCSRASWNCVWILACMHVLKGIREHAYIACISFSTGKVENPCLALAVWLLWLQDSWTYSSS